MLDWLKQVFGAPEPRPDRDAADGNPSSRACSERLPQPAIYLRTGSTTGFSRLGGLPCLPAHLAWPDFHGRPLAFLAQIDLSELHTARPSFMAASGYLFFFYDQDQSAWGSEAEDAGAWRVLYFDGDARECLPRVAPGGLDPRCIYREKPVVLLRVDLSQPGDAQDREPKHQMLGVSTSTMDPLDMGQDGSPTTLQYPDEGGMATGEADWKLLLELNSDDEIGWMWGDAGTLYFWVGEQDARQRDFSKVWMTLESS